MNLLRLAAHAVRAKSPLEILPVTPSKRQALNELLLSVVLPSLLLALALVYFYASLQPTSLASNGMVAEHTAQASGVSIQPVSYVPASATGPAWSSTSPHPIPQVTNGAAPSHLASALAGAAVLLVAAAGLVIWWSSRQSQPEPASRLAQHAPAPGEQLASTSSATAREVSQRLVAVQESVRRDMADYLHGHVQSKLLALSMSLSACQKLLARDPAHAYHLLERIQEELQRVQDEDLRQVSRELYPAIIKMGLVPAMRSLVSRFSDLMEIDLIIDTDVFSLDAAGEAILPEKQRLGIYRIAEEALNNVLKHANANHVEVNLICDASEQLALSVIDDGCGFDPRDVSTSHGLVMMSDYAEAMGAKAEIISSVGRGATVSLALPIRSSKPVATVTANGDHAPLSIGF